MDGALTGIGAARRDTTPLRRAMRAPQFRWLFAAQTVSRWGDTFSAVALVIVVYRLTGSGRGVVAVVALEILPVLLFGFVAGTVVDRLPRRQVMIAADISRAAVALGLAMLHNQLWAVYAAAFTLSALSVFFSPAAASTVPALVEEADVVGANSALWSAAVVSQIALAPVAGALVAGVGAGPAFALNAVSFAASAALLTRLADTTPPRHETRARWAEATEGFRVVRTDRFLLTLVWVQTLAALSAGGTSALLVVLAAEHLEVGPARFGVLIAAIGVGAGLGPLLLQRVAREARSPVWLYGPYLLRGVVDFALAGFRNFSVAVGALVAYGVGTSTGMVTYNSVLQTTVPERVRGRVFALYDVIWASARLISLGAGGLLADALGVRAVYVVGGALLVLAGALGLARSRSPVLA